MFKKTNFPPIFLYLFLVFLGILLLGLTGILKPLRVIVEKKGIIPLRQNVFDWQRMVKKDLVGCQLKNEAEIAQMKTKFASLEEENKEQKRLLSSPLPKNWQFLTVKVIGVEDETLIINRGRQEQVKKDQSAIIDNTYLGRVITVSENIAKIILPTFIDEKILVKMINRKAGEITGRGILIGKGLGAMRVEQILTTENVGKEDLVITNIEGGDLLVGRVEEVVKQKDEIFKSAVVKRLYNPEELETIFLIRGRL